MKPPTKCGLILATLFGLVFSAVSVLVLIQIPDDIHAGQWDSALFKAVFVVIFGCFGFPILITVFFKWKVAVQAARSRAKYPEQPWLWRADWAARRISDSSMSSMIGWWLIAVCYNVFSLPLLLLLFREVFTKGNYRALLGMLFPIISFVLLAIAISTSRRWRRFGKSVFIMSDASGKIGGTLTGSIEVQKPFATTEMEFNLELSCVQRKWSGSGKQRSMKESKLLKMENTARLDANGKIPVEFSVPTNAREVNFQNGSSQIIWRLEVDMDSSSTGPMYSATFDVPVFKMD